MSAVHATQSLSIIHATQMVTCSPRGPGAQLRTARHWTCPRRRFSPEPIISTQMVTCSPRGPGVQLRTFRFWTCHWTCPIRAHLAQSGDGGTDKDRGSRFQVVAPFLILRLRTPLFPTGRLLCYGGPGPPLLLCGRVTFVHCALSTHLHAACAHPSVRVRVASRGGSPYVSSVFVCVFYVLPVPVPAGVVQVTSCVLPCCGSVLASCYLLLVLGIFAGERARAFSSTFSQVVIAIVNSVIDCCCSSGICICT